MGVLPIFKVLRQNCRLLYTQSKSRCLKGQGPRSECQGGICFNSKLSSNSSSARDFCKYFVIVLSFVRAADDDGHW